VALGLPSLLAHRARKINRISQTAGGVRSMRTVSRPRRRSKRELSIAAETGGQLAIMDWLNYHDSSLSVCNLSKELLNGKI
jgi:hypothetical protein